MVCLIKPQFEAGKDKVGKNGVVREAQTHKEVISRIVSYADMIGFDVKAIDYSPIKGPEGNIEYLMHIVKRDDIDESILGLTEKEAEDKLSELMAEGKGLSFKEPFNELIDKIVSGSHEM